MPKMAGTEVEIRFIAVPAGGYAPLYYRAGEGALPLASVNAGDSRGLYVGGGGINRAFLGSLGMQKTGDYAARHLALLDEAGRSGEAYKRYEADDPTAFSYVYAGGTINAPGWHEGACFVDVFAPSLRPAGNPGNVAMLYLAPPYGGNHADEADFLSAVRKTAENIATAVARYNAVAATETLTAIEALRMCLFSAAIYNPNDVSRDLIALAIFDGLSAVLAAGNSGLKEIQLPFSDSNPDPMFAAVKAKLAA